MTALCGGGSSQPLPSVPRWIDFSSAVLVAALVRLGAASAAEILGPLLVLAPILADVYCGTDPPADPGLTQADVDAALNLTQPAASLAALQKIGQWFLHFYWYTICECSSVATPPQPTPTFPSGTIGINSGLPAPTAQGPCSDVQATFQVGHSNISPGLEYIDITTRLLPLLGPTQQCNTGIAGVPLQTGYTIPSGANNFNLTVSWTPALSAGSAFFVTVNFYDFSGKNNGQCTVFLENSGNSGSQHVDVIPTGAQYWTAEIDHSDVKDYQVAVHFSFYCSAGGPGSLNVDCCPPDPILEQKLDQIIGILQFLSSNQGVAADTYTPGPVHSQLQGEASFLLSKGTVAVRVVCTSDLSGFFQHTQLPTYYFSLGFLTPVSISTPLKGSRLVYGQQIYPLQPQSDQVYLSLAPGVVVDVTELRNGVR